MDERKPIHLCPNGQIEVPTTGRRYRWTPGYSQVTKTGVTQPLSRRHWYDIAKRDGERCVFHASEDEAQLASRGQFPPSRAATGYQKAKAAEKGA